MYYHRYKTDNPTQNMFHRHIHNDFEILYFVSGDADFIIEGNICRLNKGDLLLIKPRVYHYLRLRSNTKYERFVINFTEGEVESVISDGDDRCEYAKYNIPEKSVISSFFTDILCSSASSTLPSFFALMMISAQSSSGRW